MHQAEQLIGLLQKCRHDRNLVQAARLHAYLRHHGLDSDPLLGNYLVPMLVACGSLPQAHHFFFHRLPVRSEVSWTALISGHVACGNPRHAFHLYHLMQQDPSTAQPSKFTYLALLNACSLLKDADHGRCLHSDIAASGLERDVHLGSSLVHMYAKCNLPADACQVFGKLRVRDVVSWAALITGYAEHGDHEEVENCFQQMQWEGIPPDFVTFLCWLKACGIARALETAQRVHVEMSKRGLEKDLNMGSTLVDVYCKCSCLKEALQVFDSLPVRNVVSWNALIAGYAEHGLGEEVGNCYQQMKLENIAPTSVTFVSSLKACASIGVVKSGSEVHADVVFRGLERELNVGSSLVDMYVKCGLLAEAHQLFDSLPLHNAVTWASLIAGYGERGHIEEVEASFQVMQAEGVSPDHVIFVCSLKSCGASGALEAGQVVHTALTIVGLDIELYVGNQLVDMYMKCHSLLEARRVFDRLQVRDRVSWNTLNTGYVEQGLDEEVLICIRGMQSEGLPRDTVTLGHGLKACANTAASQIGQELHDEMAKFGLEKEVSLGSMLVHMYSKCGFLPEAQKIFDMLPVRELDLWTALIVGLVENDFHMDAVNVFQKLQMEGMTPDSVTLCFILRACSNIGAIDTARGIHNRIAESGLETDQFLGNMLLEAYRRYGLLVEASQVFAMLTDRETITWNTMIAGYADCERNEEVLDCYQYMQLECIPADPVTYTLTLKACGISQTLEIGRQIHSEITSKAFERELHVGSALVDMYIKCGLLQEGSHAFKQLPARDVVSWNALIAGYAALGPSEEALTCLKQMQVDGISPDSVTLLCSLKVCGSVGALEKGHEIHAEIIRMGMEKELYVGNTLLDMYIKCGSLLEANQIFAGLQVRNVVSWNAMVVGYTQQGLDEEVLKCFKEMQLQGVSMSDLTLVACLRACGTTGALETGREVHAHIRKSGLERDLVVGNTLIDMYAKCGSVAEAREVFDKLHERDVVSWTTMIKAYGENHQGFTAVQCFEDMLEQGVNPDSVTFTCLLSACTHASLVLKGQGYFKLIKEHGFEPTLDHYACMVDLFARSGRIYEAEKVVASIQCCPSSEILMALLNACKIYGKTEVGQTCFQQLVDNQEDASAYLALAEIYASNGRWIDADEIEESRKDAGSKKKLGTAWIEVDKKLHKFVVGANQYENTSETLKSLWFCIEKEGYVPSLDLVLRNTCDKEKEVTYDLGKTTSCITGHNFNSVSGKQLGLCTNV